MRQWVPSHNKVVNKGCCIVVVISDQCHHVRHEIVSVEEPFQSLHIQNNTLTLTIPAQSEENFYNGPFLFELLGIEVNGSPENRVMPKSNNLFRVTICMYAKVFWVSSARMGGLVL